MANNRDSAYRGQTVRLYSFFYSNGTLTNPYKPGTVFIHSGTLPALPEFSNVSPYHPSAGTYYVEWDIPEYQPVGYYYDVWSGIQLSQASNPINRKFSFAVQYSPSEDIPIPEQVALLSGLCRVYGFFIGSDGRALKNIRARGSIVDMPSFNSASLFVNFEESVENFTDDNGRVDWYFPRNSTVHIDVRAAGYSKVKKVPDAESVRIQNMEDG